MSNGKSPADTLAEVDAMVAEAEAEAEALGKSNQQVEATDLALKMANDYLVDLTDVKGTGKDGRIVVSDVDQYIKDNDIEKPTEPEPEPESEPEEEEGAEPVPEPAVAEIGKADALEAKGPGPLAEVRHFVRTLNRYGGDWESGGIVSAARADEKLSAMLMAGWVILYAKVLSQGAEGINIMWVMGRPNDPDAYKSYNEIYHLTRKIGGGDGAMTGTYADALVSSYLQAGWDVYYMDALRADMTGVDMIWIFVR